MQIIVAPPALHKLIKLQLTGLLTILFGIVGGVTWAAVTPLDSAVVAIGKVKVHSDRKEIQHLEGGIIKSILIAEGESVKKGQLLLALDDTFANTDLKRLRSQLQELKIQEAVLLAQRDSRNTPSFPAEIKNALSDAWVTTQLESALNGFNISQENLKNQIEILKNQSIQLNEQIKGNDEERSAKKEELYYLEDETKSWKTLIERQLADKMRYLELQRETAELRGEIAQLHSQSASLKAKKVGLQLEQSRVRQIYRETASKELSEVKINIRDISRRMESAVNVLGRIDIRSPVDGVVVGLQVHTLGAVIQPGETILELVPDNDDLIIEARVKPTDVDKIYRSLESRIKISSFKAHEFPEFIGAVDSVSADVFENPETLDNFYIARISIPPSSRSSVPETEIKPGMPAEVLIKTGETTPLQYLMEPLLSAFRTAWRDQ